MTVRVNVSLPDDLYARLEAARGDVSRSKFVLRALEATLDAREAQERAKRTPVAGFKRVQTLKR